MSAGALYGYDDAAELTGYSPETIKVYCYRGIFKRGEILCFATTDTAPGPASTGNLRNPVFSP